MVCDFSVDEFILCLILMKNIFSLIVKKLFSLLLRVRCLLSTLISYVYTLGNPLINFEEKCQFGRSVQIRATDGGVISFGKRVCVSDGVKIIVQSGRLIIEDDVFIGVGCIIVCTKDIFIGKDTLIAEYVVIRDQDHRIGSRPIRSAGFQATPIHIGSDVWIGCKASVLRGAGVGDRCVIGAHALVRSQIPEDTLAVGVPARAVKRLRAVQ
jgi:carbonic anhydrase/acetyltransferase-like protein (isoleucine patch superfamily)